MVVTDVMKASTAAVTDAAAPAAKRIKLYTSYPNETTSSGSSTEQEAVPAEVPFGFVACQRFLLATAVDKPVPTIPETLLGPGQTRNDLDRMKKLFEAHGFRTSVVMSPRPALSIYKDSCHMENDDGTLSEDTVAGKRFLLTMLGMHPNQNDMEHWYAASIKSIYCLMLFCNRIRTLCPKAVAVHAVKSLLEANELLCRALAPGTEELVDDDMSSPASVAMSSVMDDAHALASSVPERVAQLTTAVVAADPRLRVEQLEHEYERLTLWNSTLTNATLQLFLDGHNCCIQSIYFKRSHVPKYERITVYLYDPEVDLVKPPRFTFLPSLRRALDDGPDAVVQDMIESFWSNLLRHGYFATSTIKAEFTPDLQKYFLSGIAKDLNIPLLLNSHFTPEYPLSFYLHGKAGAGKSSLVRHFSPAINSAIEHHLDPELIVRFVKQNLNKPMHDLQLELELRPNNNDLSVMSIIQGRRMSMTQTKPGLVVVDLEEMASNAPDANPNQLKTAQLLSQRFSGRNSAYKEGNAAAPRNSTKRGISGDASLIVLFTSNYELEKPCQDALQRLDMFSNLKIIEMTAVDGDDRRDFAHSYMDQCVQDRFSDYAPSCDIALEIPFGSGDTRPLVRHVRMLAFYVCALAANTVTVGSSVSAKVVQNDESHLCTVSTAERSIELRVGTLDNLFPVSHQVFDSRTETAMAAIRKASSSTVEMLDELSQIIDFWFAKTLAPAVIVSRDADLISTLVKAVGWQKDVHSIEGVEAGSYKMMKSLYDPNDTPNLRDDILKFGKGAFVAVELLCPSQDGQLCIREIIEDSPSMTAFSTNKSALYKDGLIFFVHIVGDLTPEVRSRASLIL